MLGKDNITFTGNNFPHEIEGNVFELKFTNDKKTVCDVMLTKKTELACQTNKFDLVKDLGKSDIGLTMTINGKAVVYDQKFTMKSDI